MIPVQDAYSEVIKKVYPAKIYPTFKIKDAFHVLQMIYSAYVVSYEYVGTSHMCVSLLLLKS